MSLSQLPPGVVNNANANKTLEYIIGKAFLEAEKTCTAPWVLSFATPLPGVPITFHELMKILGATVCIFNCACIVYLLTGHLTCWVIPTQQKQIARIILWDFVFSVTAFFSLYFYQAEKYIHPFADYYEGFAMTAIFLLFVQLVCPNVTDRAQYFTSLERRWPNGRQKGSKGSLRWFRIIWIMVFQITFTRIATYIAQEVVYATTCPLSATRRYASLAVQIVQGISTGLTVYAVIVFERRMHNHMTSHGHRPLLKLVSFKAVVGLEAMQNVLFSALADNGLYFPKPPYHVSWADFAIGIPQFVLVLEMVLVSLLFLWAFEFEEYKQLIIQGRPIQASAWRAFLDIFDLTDIWQGVKYMFTSFTSSEYLEGPVNGRIVEGLSDRKVNSGDHQPIEFANKVGHGNEGLTA